VGRRYAPLQLSRQAAIEAQKENGKLFIEI